jgi:hypothetical protein
MIKCSNWSKFVTLKEVMFYEIWKEFVLLNVVLIFNQQIKRKEKFKYVQQIA